MADLHLSGVRVRHGARVVLDGIDLRLAPGAFVALVGANGAGKTTLLRVAAGAAKPTQGAALYDAADLAALAPADRARRVAYLPQARPLAWPIRVRDLAALGRFARTPDPAAIDAALAACGLVDLADRPASTLSGGELARAHVARALAADAPVLIADEPAAGLDPGHAWRILEVLRARAHAGAIVLASLHEPALAARFADRLLALKDGRLIGDGPPRTVLGPAFMAQAYGVATGPATLDLEIRGLVGADQTPDRPSVAGGGGKG